MLIQNVVNKAATYLFLANTSALFLTLSVQSADVAPTHDHNLEEIIVSAAFDGRKLGETILGAAVLKRDDILQELDGSLGETLKRQLGISSTFFGPGASRPIIRGLGGDRIRVLDAGLGAIDASSTSPDHAVAVEPALAERIEILRGTAMLMYGSSAAGGVINVFDGRIPSSTPENGLKGALRYGHGTVDDSDEFSGSVNAQIMESGGTKFVMHGGFSWRDTGDYKIPGYAESTALRAEEHSEEEGHEEESEHDDDHGEEELAFGIADNSAVKSLSGSMGFSALFSNGFLGFSIKGLDIDYGIPAGHAHEENHENEDRDDEDHDDEDHGEDDHEDEHGEDEVTIALDQVRYDLAGEFSGNYGVFKKAKFRFGYADYEHTELEGEEIGTVFTNEGYEGRLDLIEKGDDSWAGATGFSFRKRDFVGVGAEAFVPATLSKQYGVYSVKELTYGDLMVEIGGRLEHTSIKADSLNANHSFTGFSGSAGMGYDINEDLFVGITAYRTERAPATEALFSSGPHLATNSYELGDQSLGLESALGVEGTMTYTSGPFGFTVNAFHTDYTDFIYEAETGQIIDDLPVFQFQARNARFYGIESKAEMHLGHLSLWGKTLDWHLDTQLDYVRTSLKGQSDPLPRIPPLSVLAGLDVSGKVFHARAEIAYNASQNRVTSFERPSESYTLINLSASVQPFENKAIRFDIKANNLFNSEARQHTSFLKDLIPLPGRNLKASVRFAF